MGANAHGLLGLYTEYFRPGNAIVEIGCGIDSTPVLYDIAARSQQSFYACDSLHPEVAEIGHGKNDFHYIGQAGEQFLARHFSQTEQRISAAYLDNFDWMWNPARYRNENKPDFLARMDREYAEAGLELNNVNSSLAHLRQTILIDQYAADQCAVLYDDTWFDYAHETYLGKGSASIIYLLGKGWRIDSDVNIPSGIAVMVVKGI